MRKTMQAMVSVTVETDKPDHWTAEALANDIRDMCQMDLMSDYGNVVLMTVTPVDE